MTPRLYNQVLWPVILKHTHKICKSFDLCKNMIFRFIIKYMLSVFFTSFISVKNMPQSEYHFKVLFQGKLIIIKLTIQFFQLSMRQCLFAAHIRIVLSNYGKWSNIFFYTIQIEYQKFKATKNFCWKRKFLEFMIILHFSHWIIQAKKRNLN